jgi:S-DNA-T family DNA segregation ATPase FtsK/SpoIIIE
LTDAAARRSRSERQALRGRGAIVARRHALGAGALALIVAGAAVLPPHDPGFSDTGEPGPVSNWIGPVGAWLAGFFLFLFGRPAYLFPLMLAYAGWLVHKEQALPDARSRINTCCARQASC